MKMLFQNLKNLDRPELNLTLHLSTLRHCPHFTFRFSLLRENPDFFQFSREHRVLS